MDQKIFWFLTYFGSKKCFGLKIFLVQKNLASTNFGSKIYGSKKVFGPKKYQVQKYLVSGIKICVQKILDQKIFVSENVGW